MEFDLSKENIQPLRGGRNVVQLGVALQAQGDMEHQRELLQQKGEFEKLIHAYTGDDPLENWYNYISWVEQSFPKQGHEGNLISLLEHCLSLFEHDNRYREDRRLCKLFIKYIDHQHNPIELYRMMYAQGLCRSCSDMYKAWAYYYEAGGDFQNAHRVFECGKRELAQPYEELQIAHENLVMAAGHHIIYGPNERELSEKRQALTSLQTYKSGQVFSVRNADFSHVGGVGAPVMGRSNISVAVYEDKGDEVHGAEAGPTSIVTAAKRQEVRKENTLKPGPWTTLPVKKKQAGAKSTPSFTVHEDSDDTSNGFKLSHFVSSTLENYSNWIVNLTIPEPKDDRMIPVYPKDKVYFETGVEYSLEELRSRRYCCDKKPVMDISRENPVQSFVANASVSFSKIKDEPNPEQMLYQNSFQQNEQRKSSFSTSTIFKTEQHALENTPPKLTAERNSAVGGIQNINYNFWDDSFKSESPNTSVNVIQKASAPKFSIYEQTALEEHMGPKGSAMKTPFKDLNAEELAETGSRGGMDIAAAAPVDSAKRLPIYDDDSSSYEDIMQPGNFGNLTCNTQMFNFNLNAMQVSTPQNKELMTARSIQDSVNITPKQLFTDTKNQDDKNKVLSTILEETKSYGSSSSSGTTKSSLFGSQMKQTNMATISEEHNSYLAQNLMVNAALRSSLGHLMDFNQHSPVPLPRTSTVPSAMSTTPPAPTKAMPLTFVPSDPFKQSVIENLLQRVNFPGPHTEGYCCIGNILKPTVRKESIGIGSDRYIIEKQLGKGTYGTVFRGVEVRTGNTVAVKYQRPANRWEFYICRELRARLTNHPLRERFMDVTIGYFSDQASVLISEFMPCGSLLDVANLVKQKSGRSMKESLCIHFCLEMLKVVQAMHEVQIIHADVKPDNFLVQLLPNDIIGLQLIDFGCSIDMSLYPPGTSFTRRVTTENFVCCEMLDNRPWNYHTDLFCVAATAHVLLFEKYIQLQKKDMHWSISNRLPRYARLDLWNMFFSTLLNQQEGPANSVQVQAMLEDSLNHKFDDYHNELRYLVNILKNR